MPDTSSGPVNNNELSASSRQMQARCMLMLWQLFRHSVAASCQNQHSIAHLLQQHGCLHTLLNMKRFQVLCSEEGHLHIKPAKSASNAFALHIGQH